MKQRLNEFYTKKIRTPFQDWASKVYVSRHKVPLLSVLRFFSKKMIYENPDEKASSMAFNLILSIFPGVIFLFTLIPYIPIPELKENILLILQETLPENIYLPAAATITDIIEIQREGLLSLGFISSVFFATNSIRTMMLTFNSSYEATENRSFIRRIVVSILIAFLLLTSIVTLLSLSILIDLYLLKFGKAIYLDMILLQYLLLVIKYVIFFFIFVVIIAIIYYTTPAAKTELNFFSAGVFIAAFLCLLFTLGFSFYVNNFDSYNKLYGSIGALMGILVWFYMICLMLLIGFEINSSIELARREKMNKKP